VFLGHYGVALAAKRAAPRTSAGTTVLAAQFLDLLWPLLLLVGLESVRIVPGLMAASALEFEHYPISHSLLTTALWALLVAGIYHGFRRYRTGALVVCALVLSHWLLDAVMHQPDLPLWPGSGILVGGGLWNSLAATLALEFGLFGAGVAVYAGSTRPVDRIGRWGLWSLVALLVLFYLGSLTGPPPDTRSLAIGGLALWLFVPWMAWVDRHRVLAGGGAAERTGDAAGFVAAAGAVETGSHVAAAVRNPTSEV
jgi:hypothetical protein